ncbi:hypothetical protein RRG08_013488 [Elysia crispata]|uniref:Uncharacterized protein n=1 Tax=Elysia crispata TaxID=231223 RepID=A0AAE0Y0M2_9GAST|nr:hypothetical protein RRG08_013488 [Elysia crispata]
MPKIIKNPYIRGKQLVDFSRLKTEQGKLCWKIERSQVQVLENSNGQDLPASHRIERLSELDLAVVTNQLPFSKLPSLSTVLTVAKFIMKRCLDNQKGSSSNNAHNFEQMMNIEVPGAFVDSGQ